MNDEGQAGRVVSMKDGWRRETPMTARRVALGAVYVQFAALVRTLAEVFRLKHFDQARYTLAVLEPFVGAALFTSVLLAASVAAFAAGRPRLVLAVAITNVVALLVYRFVFM